MNNVTQFKRDDVIVVHHNIAITIKHRPEFNDFEWSCSYIKERKLSGVAPNVERATDTAKQLINNAMGIRKHAKRS